MGLTALPFALALATLQAGGGEPAPVPAPVEQPAAPAATLPPCPAADPLAGAQPVAPTPAPDTPAEGGAIVVTARPDSQPGDPMLQLNAQSFEVVQDVDEALVGPVAMAYKDAVPKPVRHGIRNFLRNLTEPIVALNFLLQLKPGKAAETVGRFAINSTIGIGGLFDVAKREPFKLPYRRNGFANTLGYYGVEPGAYLFLPLIGPTTVRDLVGGTIDGLLLPTVVGAPFNDPYFTLPAATLSALQGRIQIDEQLNALRTQSRDPYIAARDFYLKRRQAEIDALKGKVAYPDGDLPFVNPGTGGPIVVPVTPVVPAAPAANCVPMG
jgi:phospholipid-binding lipoprotein MlaA